MTLRALLFSSGGAKGAFQVGAAEHLIEERGLDFEVIAGTSTGCLNAALLAHGKGLAGLREEVRLLKDLWLSIRGPDDVYRRRFLSPLLIFYSKTSLYSAGPLRRRIEARLDPERLRASGRELRVGAVELETGKFHTVTQHDPHLREWVLASAALPVIFPPVQVAGVHAVDGGVRQFQPLEIALDALNRLGGDDDEREVYCLLADPLQVPERRDGFDTGERIARRIASIPPIEAFQADFARAIRQNRAVRAYLAAERELRGLPGGEPALEALRASPYRPPAFRDTRLFVIAPEREYMGSLEFDPEKIRAAYEAGRRAARAPLDEAALDRVIPQES